ncbi:hypothetical protein JTB14_035264 [Gonioctena quinquepunctata]|nr:hypothetical protein JTB14_035264 [Gonioctena quinquepunctata]
MSLILLTGTLMGGVDVTTQASNDLFQDSDEENPIDVPTGNPNNKAVTIDWKVDPTDMKSIPFKKQKACSFLQMATLL